MKTFSCSLPLAILLAVSGLGLPAGGQETKLTGTQVYEKGRAALNRGDLPEARKCFEMLLKAKPDFELARIQLAQVVLAEKEQAKIPQSLKVARKAVVNRIEWSGATLDEAVATAAKQLEKASGVENWTVTTTNQLPEKVSGRLVSLSVSGIPVDHLLEALGFAGGVRFSYTASGLAVKEETGGARAAWDAGNPKLPSMDEAAKKLVIDRLQFKEAKVEDALAFLQEKAATVSGGRLKPVFAARYDLAAGSTVTMDLRNISLYDALHSVCMVADMEERWFPWGAGIGNQTVPVPASAPKGNAPK